MFAIVDRRRLFLTKSEPTAGPITGPKIDPIPCHKGAAPSSPAQLGELTRLAEVKANAITADRKLKPISDTSCLGRHCDNIFEGVLRQISAIP